MAKLRGCRTCFVEFEEIALANGSVVLFCATCDVMADPGHHAGGRRPWAAGMARRPLKLVVDRPKTVIVKKFSYPGKKSLTA